MVPAVSVTGAVGSGVSTGTGKALTWNAGADWNGPYSPQVRFKVVADDVLAPPDFASIPEGAFSMGDSLDGIGDAPVRAVAVSAFYLGKTEVTKGEWDEVQAWAAGRGYPDLSAGAGQAAHHPVTDVSWWDAVKWCNARSEKEGLAPCYAVGGSPMRTGTTVPTVSWAAQGYRLPTKADTDGDGYFDGAEVALGGDPLDAAQGPVWQAECRASATNPGAVEIRFPSAVGRTYAVEVSRDLKRWDVLQNGLVGDGRVLAREVLGEGAGKRYFRVR